MVTHSLFPVVPNAKLPSMIDLIYSLFSHDIALDLGTANCVVYVKGKGILIREPSVVAINRRTSEIIAVGVEAKKMLGKTPQNISAVRPLRDGVISDFDVTFEMIAYFIRKVHRTSAGFSFLVRPKIVVGVPSGITEVERRAVVDAATRAGAREVLLLEEPMAAAIGAGLPVMEPTGSMIVDIGGGTCEMAVISLGGIVIGKSIRLAGDKMDLEIVNAAKEKYDLVLGEKIAEEVKMQIGSVFSFKGEEEMTAQFRGRDLKSGLPRSVDIKAVDLREILLKPLGQIVESIKETIEDTPPELIADITRQGIILAGGSAQIRGIEALVAQETKVPVRVAEHPMDCVVRGCAKALEDPGLLKKVRLH